MVLALGGHRRFSNNLVEFAGWVSRKTVVVQTIGLTSGRALWFQKEPGRGRSVHGRATTASLLDSTTIARSLTSQAFGAPRPRVESFRRSGRQSALLARTMVASQPDGYVWNLRSFKLRHADCKCGTHWALALRSPRHFLYLSFKSATSKSASKGSYSYSWRAFLKNETGRRGGTPRSTPKGVRSRSGPRNA